jgi:hypothetical protein
MRSIKPFPRILVREQLPSTWFYVYEPRGVNGDVANIMGGFDATLSGGVVFDSTHGKFGKCLYFPATSAGTSGSAIRVVKNSAFRPTNGLTLAAWINVSSFTDFAKIFSLDYRANSTWGAPFVAYQLTACGGGNQRPQFGVTTSGSLSSINGSTDLLTDTWYHVCGTWDGTNLTLYINGIVDAIGSKGGTLDYGTGADLAIGQDSFYNSVGELFNGYMDDLRIYPYALGGDEVAKIASNPFYHFEDQNYYEDTIKTVANYAFLQVSKSISAGATYGVHASCAVQTSKSIAAGASYGLHATADLQKSKSIAASAKYGVLGNSDLQKHPTISSTGEQNLVVYHGDSLTFIPTLTKHSTISSSATNVIPEYHATCDLSPFIISINSSGTAPALYNGNVQVQKHPTTIAMGHASVVTHANADIQKRSRIAAAGHASVALNTSLSLTKKTLISSAAHYLSLKLATADFVKHPRIASRGHLINPIGSGTLDLFVGGREFSTESINLFVRGGNPTVYGSIPLFLWNTQEEAAGFLDLFVQGYNLSGEVMNLFVEGAGSGPLSSSVLAGSSIPLWTEGVITFTYGASGAISLFLKVQDANVISNVATLYVRGAAPNTASGTIPLVIPKTKMVKNTTLYVRGF